MAKQVNVIASLNSLYRSLSAEKFGSPVENKLTEVAVMVRDHARTKAKPQDMPLNIHFLVFLYTYLLLLMSSVVQLRNLISFLRSCLLFTLLWRDTVPLTCPCLLHLGHHSVVFHLIIQLIKYASTYYKLWPISGKTLLQISLQICCCKSWMAHWRVVKTQP